MDIQEFKRIALAALTTEQSSEYVVDAVLEFSTTFMPSRILRLIYGYEIMRELLAAHADLANDPRYVSWSKNEYMLHAKEALTRVAEIEGK